MPKPKPGSRQTLLLRNPLRDGERQPLLEECRHVCDDVVVARVELHRPRLALHVHQADVGVLVRHDAGELGVAAQRRDVVHELGAESERPPRNLGLRGVDRDGQALEPLEDGDDPAKLLVDRDGVRPRPRGLTADVDDRSALVEQPPRRRNCDLGTQMHPAVSEAVGRDVDDPHHRGPPQTFLQRRTSH